MERRPAGAGMFTHLAAPGPHESLGAHAETYGWLVGSWRGEYTDYDDDRVHRGAMEVHFAWVLEGRAIQDVWIAPPVGERAAASGPAPRDTYGTTLRIFDPAIDAWRVTWFNPGTGVRNELIGRRVGNDIVQVGWHETKPIKWMFTDIAATSFVWRGFVQEPDGETWRLRTEFRLTRAGHPGGAG